ncbi:MAG: acetyl-CoA carboxylase biotin carboxylase subunit [Candidatus Pseudoruminococcus sp.]|uniref:acetyl-CoA carboxylase biotin carboxylase subunit n=1 Tax=Candidatus Pseudoruminococcus sp. TaxID=3101048 RepID=UPI002A7C24A4|nr:acetyl-CoA carboxylase biotin carboxylase subunit [Ruminococcus sp.]MDY2782017.1 acetyl-CoA carboxylase biotin carboxylase subunit [Candidatus Pseudoruminococcus sp.]
MFSKILIANRGEIAVRIIRACREMGISTVAVYSQADKDALHVSIADESYCIGGPQVGDSYLNMAAILTVAVISGAQAIHPGYGLLSENAKFVSLCEKCNIEFIGPSSEMISKLGDKDEARRTMRNAGVPVTPGTDIIEDVNIAKEKAAEIGYPILIKARSGGGGRGIRLVHNENEFENAFHSASAEAQSAFGDGAVYIEKYLKPVKHIEMQLLCDKFGNVVCLGERECSVQRKNQKLIEESPSPAITPEIRANMMAAAKKAALAVGYENAGTVEFLLDKDKNFYFMEMNTRLQVEHPVTEMVVGIDLVQWQIRIAAGAKLSMTQDKIFIHGSAIECRINAEDPNNNYRPSCGTINLLHIPGGPQVRFDTAIYQDYTVPPYYDSMIGKLIVQARSRELAIRKMKMALSELIIQGITHNRNLHLDILSDKEFVDGTYTTGFMEDFDKRRNKQKDE